MSNKLSTDDLDTIANATAQSPRATTVHGPDWPRGHVVVETDGDDRHPDPLVFVDLGPVLDVWSGQGASITPTTARSLGQALIEWADRRSR